MNTTHIINEKEIHNTIAANRNNTTFQTQVHDILDKARELHGLTLKEATILFSVNNQKLQKEIFETAEQVKNKIYGSRIVIFAPLYVSNLCYNNCLYCAFRSNNK